MRLGKLNVDKMLRKITAKQFRDWEIYASLEPFDEKRGDYRAAQIVQMLYNVNRGPKTKPITIEECMLEFELPERKKTLSRSATISVIKAIVAANNAAFSSPSPEDTK